MKENKEANFIVGVGLSEGGLDALSKFLRSFKKLDPDFCIVVVMQVNYLSKQEYDSFLKEQNKWPIVPIEKDIQLQPGQIYVAAPNSYLQFKNNRLTTVKPSNNTPIDVFFTSLAKEKKEKAIGIILSGTGNDGSLGIASIKEENGYKIAQIPHTAEDESMPTKAIESQNIDLVLPVEQMHREIMHYINNYKIATDSSLPRDGIEGIFELLEKRSGTDFSQYKPATIIRRVNYRIDKLKVNSLADYNVLIKNAPRELDILFETVLIGVTEFFRDADAFTAFANNMKELMQQKEQGDTLRIWCAGCASGEEPYSVAMMLHEKMGREIVNYDIQIFGTDIDERTLNFARKAVYNKNSLGNLDPKLVSKYFDRVGNLHYEIKKKIKEHILFTKHDITNDPPFVKLDAVVCRNLLIYFNNNLQKQIFRIFHFSLKKNGHLFLGSSEAVHIANELFTKVDEHKLYRKTDTGKDYNLKFSHFKNKNEVSNPHSKSHETRGMSVVDIAKETLYYKNDNPFVIINEQGEIKEVNGSLRLYMEIGQGTMNANLHKMVNTELVTFIKVLLSQVKKYNVPQSSQIIKFRLYDSNHYVRIKIIPLIYTINESQYFIVVFEKIVPGENHLQAKKDLSTEEASKYQIQELEDEVISLKRHFQVFREELETSNEELQVMNEELQSTNEELKSANEEMVTSNEELQWANEELNSVNQDLYLSNESLKQKEEELKKERNISRKNEIIYRSMSENIPNGSIGILNEKLEIEYLVGKGIKPFSDNPDNLIGKPFSKMIPLQKQEFARLSDILSNTVQGESGNTEFYYNNNYYDFYAALIKLPSEDKNKVLFLIQNITQAKKDKLQAMMAIEAAELIVYEYNFKTKSFQHNEALLNFFELEKGEILDIDIFENKIHPEDIDQKQQKNKEALKNGSLSYETRIILKKGIRWIRVFGRILFDENNKPELEVATLMDITKDKLLLEQVRESEERFKLIADSAPVMIWKRNKDKTGSFFNRKWLEFTGNLEGKEMDTGRLENVHPEDIDEFESVFNSSYKKRSSYLLEYRLRRSDGVFRWIMDHGVPVINENNYFEGFIGSSN